MSVRRLVPLAALLFPFLSAAAGAQDAPAVPLEASARYEVRWSGFTVGEIALTLKDDLQSRELGLEARTSGMLDWIVAFRSLIESRAVRRDGAGAVVETRFHAARWMDDEEQAWSMLFGEKGELIESDIPAEVTAEREAVPPHLRRGPDPLALAGDLIALAGPDMRIERSSFDGKRAVSLVLSCAGDREAVASLPDLPPAPALACDLDGELLAGASKRWSTEDEHEEVERDRGVEIWLSDALLPGRHLPVLAHGQSRWGIVVARLVDFSLTSP